MKTLRPHDVYVLLAITVLSDAERWTYDSLSERLGLSTSQVYRALERSGSAHLFNTNMRRVRPPELVEFLTHGVRYAFPAVPTGIERGVPTCWKVPGLTHLMSTSSEELFVWPAPGGTARGQAIEPLHSAAIATAGREPKLYRLLGLVDILRVGSARERKVATTELEDQLL